MVDLPTGTPNDRRSTGFITPRRPSPTLRWSLALALATVAVFVASFMRGNSRPLSPAPIAMHHASFENTCAQCHQTGNAVVDLRCERCHDSSLTDRLTNAAHVLLGSGSTVEADRAPAVACATCHRDHLGRDFAMARVEPGECASCHRDIRAFGSHPEFAVVAAQVQQTAGIQFSHARHLDKYAREKQPAAGQCRYCHVPTPDGRAFQPMNYDRQCGACHTPILLDTKVTAEKGAFVRAEALPAYWRDQTSVRTTANGIDEESTGLRHRDGWVIANALRFRQSIDPDGVRSEQAALQSRIAYLTNYLSSNSTNVLSVEELSAGIGEARAEIAAYDAAIAGAQVKPSDNLAALRDVTSEVQRLAGALGPVGDAAAAAQLLKAPPGLANPAPSQRAAIDVDTFDRRKKELLGLLDQIEQIDRRGRASPKLNLSARVAALKPRVQALTLQSGEPVLADLQVRLEQLEQIISTVAEASRGSSRADAFEIELQRRSAQQRLNGGLAYGEFAAARTQLLSLLDTLERRGGDVGGRAASLRQQVLALPFGSPGPDELNRLRRGRQRVLDRLLLEQRLRLNPELKAVVPRAAAPDQRILTRLQRTLTEWQQVPAAAHSDPSGDRDLLYLLVDPCRKCHVESPSGLRFATVRIDDPVLPNARFNHAPHVIGRTCESCHGSARTSSPGVATDVHVPGVETCKACHKPSGVRADCATCHVYHPTSTLQLIRW